MVGGDDPKVESMLAGARKSLQAGQARRSALEASGAGGALTHLPLPHTPGGVGGGGLLMGPGQSSFSPIMTPGSPVHGVSSVWEGMGSAGAGSGQSPLTWTAQLKELKRLFDDHVLTPAEFHASKASVSCMPRQPARQCVWGRKRWGRRRGGGACGGLGSMAPRRNRRTQILGEHGVSLSRGGRLADSDASDEGQDEGRGGWRGHGAGRGGRGGGGGSPRSARAQREHSLRRLLSSTDLAAVRCLLDSQSDCVAGVRAVWPLSPGGWAACSRARARRRANPQPLR
eukprot:COSAG01_NODE_4650_length_4850_cov_2.236211_3_plen_285_part_00